MKVNHHTMAYTMWVIPYNAYISLQAYTDHKMWGETRYIHVNM